MTATPPCPSCDYTDNGPCDCPCHVRGPEVAAMSEPATIVDKRAKARPLADNGEREPRRILPHATLRENLAEERAQTERNIRNVAGACWWHGQAAEQRGDHTEAARQGIARGRVLAEAKRQGLKIGV